MEKIKAKKFADGIIVDGRLLKGVLWQLRSVADTSKESSIIDFLDELIRATEKGETRKIYLIKKEVEPLEHLWRKLKQKI